MDMTDWFELNTTHDTTTLHSSSGDPGLKVMVCFATGRGPVQPEKGAYGNAILRFPLDLSDVEDFFIPANGVYLDNVRPLTSCCNAPCWPNLYECSTHCRRNLQMGARLVSWKPMISTTLLMSAWLSRASSPIAEFAN